MIAVDIGSGGVLQVILLHVRKNLLPPGQILHQTVECLEPSQRNQSVNKPLLCNTVFTYDQDKIEGRQISDQQKKVGNRLIRGQAERIPGMVRKRIGR